MYELTLIQPKSVRYCINIEPMEYLYDVGRARITILMRIPQRLLIKICIINLNDFQRRAAGTTGSRILHDKTDNRS